MEREIAHALVNRDALAELLEQLVQVRPRRRGSHFRSRPRPRRKRRRLPIVVAYGPGGAGKSTLLSHLGQRWEGTVPLARVRVDQDGPDTSTEALLQRAYRELTSERLADFGRLRMPRFKLARSVLAARLEDTPNRPTRRDAEARATGVSAVLAATPFEEDVLRDIAAVFTAEREGEPIRQALKRLPALRRSSTLHAGHPWLRYLLFSPGKARLLGWFGALAERLDLSDAGQGAAHVLAHLWHRPAESDAEWDVAAAGLSVTAQRILATAFLADLEQAYRRTHWRRRVHCALLIDDADLLRLDDTLRLTFQGSAQAQDRPDALGLLAEAKGLYPDAPLLVVAAKQDAPPDDPAARFLRANSEPDRAAAETQAGWLRRYDPRRPTSAFLHVPLAPFDEAETARYVGVWASAQNRMTRTAERTAELHQVSRGHPRALWLLAEALVLRSDWTSAVPGVRSLLTAPVPPAAEGLERYETIAEAVLHGFLQRFVDDESGDRSQTRQWLRRLAAARFIDVGVVGLLVGGTDARQFYAKLARYSIVTQQRSDRLVLHPLLRDLLHLDLLDADPAEYDDTHVALLGHFQARASIGEPVGDEVLYHHLALGNERPLVRAVASGTQPLDRSPEWLESIVDVPGRKSDTASPGRPGDGATPDVRAAYLVSTLRRLLSTTSVQRWTAEMLADVSEAYRTTSATKDSTDGRHRRYHLLSRAVDHSTLAPRAAPPASSRGHLAYPYSRLYRHRGKVAIAGLLTFLAAAAGTYVKVDTYWDLHCRQSTYGLGQQAWLATLGSDTFVLDRADADQCVGLTNTFGPLTYSGRPDVSSGGREIAYLYQKIIDENELAVQRASAVNPPRPVATIAVAAILTSSADGSHRDLYGGLNELRGAYLAQWVWNRKQEPALSNSFFIRLVLANFGQDAEDAMASAQALRESGVLAVTGFGQTRDATLKAADALRAGDDAVPIVSSALSGNKFSTMRGFLRAGPTNRRLAEAGMDFVKRDFRGRTPFILYDGGDEYSWDLHQDYVNLFSHAAGLFPPSVLRGFSPTTAKEDIADIAKEICERAMALPENDPKAPLVLYFGRANQVYQLVSQLDEEGCLDQVDIVGGDDLTDHEADEFTDLMNIAGYDDQLSFTTFGPADDGDATYFTDSPQTETFFDEYREIQGESHGRAYTHSPNGHIMLAYDAVNLVADAIGRNRSGLPSRAELLEQLVRTRKFQGAAGTVTIANGVDPEDKLVVVQRVVREQDGRAMTLKNIWSNNCLDTPLGRPDRPGSHRSPHEHHATTKMSQLPCG
jgi:ABC-type branched-subunit amino acid transport system substrate-binding protein